MKTFLVRLSLAAVAMLVFSACRGEVNGVPQERAFSTDSNVQQGRLLIASYGCGSCHTIPGVPGADAKAAPSLDYFYQRTYIAGRLPNTWDNLVQWIQDPQLIEPGTAMPNLGVTEADAQNITAYLYHQQTLFDLLYR